MVFYNLVGSILHQVVTWLLVVAMVSTSAIPIIQRLPRATSAYLGMMQQLGLIEADATSSSGFRSTAPAGMEGLVPTLDANGEPVGFLLNAEAFQMDQTEFEPPSVANPMTVSRVQSTYAAAGALSNTLVITFTITNNRPPAITPEIDPEATITDTIAAVSAIDFSKDPNVIRNVLLADELLPANAVFVTASPLPDRSENVMAWNLGDVPPLGSVTATLTVEIPTGPYPDFVALDTGATAWGTLQGRMVSAATAQASLAPDGFGDWLQWTVDADYYDEYMVTKAAELGNEWEQMFAYVRSLGYESYKGSLRGTRGTLWSEAGNSLDQASLLIAMLRGSGIPARYRHGTLSQERAQELILSMFPEPTGTIGHIPPGTEVADPANDPQLLAETTDHWWVLAYLPGLGWTNLDPCFATAAPGQTFHDSLVIDGTDQIAEVPDAQRHKVTMTVKTESYHPLNISQSGLKYSYPLSHTFNTVELVGRPVTLGHLVNTAGQTGMVFYSVRHTYVPYFAVGDFEVLIEGAAFQEMLSNFPFGTMIVTAEWLLFEVRDADGNVEHYEREIVDRVGFENRQTGGTLDIGEDVGTEPIVTNVEVLTFLIQPSRVPQDVVLSYSGQTLKSTSEAMRDFFEDSDESTGVATIQSVREMFSRIFFGMELIFVYQSDAAFEHLSRTSLGVSYFDSPRIIGVSSRVVSTTTLQLEFDLRKNDVRVALAPGQNPIAGASLNVLKGFSDGYWEDYVLNQLGGTNPRTTYSIFKTALDEDIALTIITDQEFDKLDRLDISTDAKARIRDAVERGMVVITPERMVFENQFPGIGWWELNPQTGEMLPGLEGGLRSGMFDYSFIQYQNELQMRALEFEMGVICGFIARRFIEAAKGIIGNVSDSTFR